jgi:hypothetical protein
VYHLFFIHGNNQVTRRKRCHRLLARTLSIPRTSLSKGLQLRKVRVDKTPDEVKERIVEFYKRDSCSRLTTGKNKTLNQYRLTVIHGLGLARIVAYCNPWIRVSQYWITVSHDKFLDYS